MMGLSEYNYLRLRSPVTGKIPERIRGRELRYAKTLPTVESIRHLNKPENVSEYEWKARGPFNIGGRTKAIGIDIRDENILVAGAATGGIWKSTDNGQSWDKRTNPEDLHSTTCLIQDTRPGKEDIWYAGTGEYIGTGGEKSRIEGNSPLRGDGIFKSTDNGETWNLLSSTSTATPEVFDQDFDHVWNLAIDYSNTDQHEVYAAVYGAIYRSLDGGETWECVLGGSNMASAYTDVCVSSTGVIYATLCWGSAKGIWRSGDGTNWIKISPVSWPSYTRRVVIAIAPSNEDVVYFLADISPDWTDQRHQFWKYTYLSGDGSGSDGLWENRSANLPDDFNSQLSYCLLNKVHPQYENLVFIGGVRLYRSTNGFQTSSSSVIHGTHIQPNNHVDQHDFMFSYANPDVVYLTHDGGVNKSTNIRNTTVQWLSLNNGYQTTQFYTAAIVPNISHDLRIIGGLQDNGTCYTDNDDPDRDWEMVNWSDGGFAAFLEDGNKLITSFQNGEIFISSLSYRHPNTNDVILTRINPQFTTPKIFFCPFIIDPTNENIAYLGGSHTIYRCDQLTAIPLNGSQTAKSGYWTPVATFSTAVSALGISRNASHILYAGTISGGVYKIDHANETSPIKTPLHASLPDDVYVSSIAVDQRDASHLVVTFSNYETKSVYSTTDGGVDWIDISGNLEEFPDGSGSGPSVLWAAILYTNGSNTYFVGTSTGLYSTQYLDGTNTVWLQEGASTIGNVVVDMVVTRECDGNVVVATHGNGIYSTVLPVSVDDMNSKLPNDFTIYPNYPNPFNPSTHFRFSLPFSQDVLIDIVNIDGQTVETLPQKNYSAGIHDVPFDGTNLASGVYFYRISFDRIVKTGKMIRMK